VEHRKYEMYEWILLAGAAVGIVITLLDWLPRWTPFATPQWLVVALYWVGVTLVLVLGFLLGKSHAFLSRLFIMACVVVAGGLAWLFPDNLAPGCGGIPIVLAHYEQKCTQTCQQVCTDWVPLSDPKCAAEPHQPWDVGCCWAYATQCTTTCNQVWVDDPPTVSGTVNCGKEGSGGWCVSGASLDLTASDPQNYPLTIAGTIGGTSFSCSGTSCSENLPEGTGSTSFTATASGGGNLSSSPGNASYQVDTVAPSLTFTTPTPDGANGWFVSSPVTASASATDATSGVASVSINGSGDSFTTSTDGTYPLTAVATDNAGNTATASGTIKIDTVPPTLSVSASTMDGNNGWYKSPAVITATASDATSGLASVQYQVDGGSWQDGTQATIEDDGKHTIVFQATDQAGNKTTAAPVTVQVDATTPNADVQIASPDGKNGWYVKPVSVTSNCSDATSGVASQGVSLDGKTWSPSVTVSNDGTTTVQVQCQDNAGNSSSDSKTVRLDTTAPTASLDIPAADGANGWYIKPVNVSVSGTDATSGVASQLVSLDGSNWSSSLALSNDGVYNVRGLVTDVAGNSTTVSQIVSVDHTPPSLTAPSLSGTRGQGGWYTTNVGVSASATDATSGLASLMYSVDGDALSSSAPTLTDGKHTVKVQATDTAGNVSTESIQVNVDTVPPQTTFNHSGTVLAYGDSFTLSGQSMDATSGIAAAQISMDNGSTWQPLSLAADGSWSYTWNTTNTSNGSHTVLVNVSDQAGNQKQYSLSAIVANVGPSVSITSSFMVYQKAKIQISAGVLPVIGATIVVSNGNHNERTIKYAFGSLPSSFQWDGAWEDGSMARPGSYQVEISVWDVLGKNSHAFGTVYVPYPPTPTDTPSPTPTRTYAPTGQPTRVSMSQVQAPSTRFAASTPIATPVVEVKPVAEQSTWPVTFVGSLFTLFLSASLLDPRPAAWLRLARAKSKSK